MPWTMGQKSSAYRTLHERARPKNIKCGLGTSMVRFESDGMQDPYRCLEITVLKKSRCDEARQLLDRVAKQVQPIMRKRQWTVKKLSEFSPRNPGLLGLNVNRGAEVKIRLRPARDEDSFYDWNHILGTMLHELCHIVIGPHNAAFYKLLDELWSEAEDLMDRGISGSGQGFDAASVGRLGSHAFIPIHNPPDHKMADAIRKAAEARARQQSLMPSGPRKLGSTGSSGINHKQLTPAQAAAAAAERRAHDNVWCGAEHSADEVEREVGEQADSLSGAAAGVSRVAAAAAAGASLPRAGAAGARQQQRAAAAASLSGPLHPQQGAASGSLQQQQQQQQQQWQQQQQPQSDQQQAALQQQWQQHLQQRRSQLQQQQQPRRKRPAVDVVDLTLSDTEGDEVPAQVAAAAGTHTGSSSHAAAAAGGSVEAAVAATSTDAAAADSSRVGGHGGVGVICPCCAAAVDGVLDAAVMQRLQQRPGYQQWCELHQRLRGEQQRQRQGQRAAAAAEGGQAEGTWTCRVCTLVNPGRVLVCEACLSVKNLI